MNKQYTIALTKSSTYITPLTNELMKSGIEQCIKQHGDLRSIKVAGLRQHITPLLAPNVTLTICIMMPSKDSSWCNIHLSFGQMKLTYEVCCADAHNDTTLTLDDLKW